MAVTGESRSRVDAPWKMSAVPILSPALHIRAQYITAQHCIAQHSRCALRTPTRGGLYALLSGPVLMHCALSTRRAPLNFTVETRENAILYQLNTVHYK